MQSLLVAADRRPGITRLCALVSREAQVAAVAVLVQRLPRLRELDLEGRPEDDDPDIDLLPPVSLGVGRLRVYAVSSAGPEQAAAVHVAACMPACI